MSETRTTGLPSVEDVARAIHGADCCPMESLTMEKADATRVLALFEAAVPHIKAEALKSAAIDWWVLNRIYEEGGEVLGGMAEPVSDWVNLTTDEWLHDRADQVEGGRVPPLDHSPILAAADRIKAEALREAAAAIGHGRGCAQDDGDPYVGCSCGISLVWARADRIESEAGKP